MAEKIKILGERSRDANCEYLCTIEMRETLRLNRFGEPVTLGVPFPKGKVFDATQLIIFNDRQESSPTQIQVLARWSDGSLKAELIKWLCVLSNPFASYSPFCSALPTYPPPQAG